MPSMSRAQNYLMREFG